MVRLAAMTAEPHLTGDDLSRGASDKYVIPRDLVPWAGQQTDRDSEFGGKAIRIIM